jgi:hypothetical protein
MKTSLALIAGAMLVAGGAVADSSVIIKQRAKEISAQNNAEQGVTPPGKPAQPAATTQNATLTPLQAAIAQLRTDLAAIKASPAPTAQQKQLLAQHLIATSQGAKPSQQTATKLAGDLTSALAQSKVSGTDRDRLLADINAALNPQKLQPDQLIRVEADAQAILQTGGLSRTDASAVADDVKAVAAETKR